MSTIELDPVAMEATAAAISHHVDEIVATVASLEAACCVDVPAHLAAWLADELHDIAVVSRTAALCYAVAALETALRARQIDADQSLVAAVPSLGTATIGGDTSLTFPVSLAAPASMVVGGDTSLTFPVSLAAAPASAIVGGTGPYASSASTSVTITIPPVDLDQFAGLSPSDLRAVTGILDRVHDGVATQLAPSGLVYEHGAYVDNAGNRGDLSHVYPDPSRPGSSRIRL